MSLNEIMKEVMQIIKAQTEKEDLGYDDLLLENGIDSVNIIEIIVEIEEAFGIEFDNAKLSYNLLRSTRSISEHIESIMNKKAATHE